jgi:dnd system-associated protein 4
MKTIEQIAIRRPRQYEDFIQGLAKTRTANAPFKAMYDVLVFAASLGFKMRLKESFNQKDGEIEYRLMQNNKYFETLMSAMAVLQNIGDHACLSAERLEERVLLFEEYMCGGLTYIYKDLVIDKYKGSHIVYFETLISNQLEERRD